MKKEMQDEVRKAPAIPAAIEDRRKSRAYATHIRLLLNRLLELDAGTPLDAEQHEGDTLQNALPTGYDGLDRAIGGLAPGSLWVVCGRSRSGKTAFGLGLALHAAVRQKQPALFISGQHSDEQAARMALCGYGRLPNWGSTPEMMGDENLSRLFNTLPLLEQSALYFDSHTPSAKERGVGWNAGPYLRWKLDACKGIGLRLVVLDGCHFLGRSDMDRVPSVAAHWTSDLKALAEQLHITIVVLVELSTANEQGVTLLRPKLQAESIKNVLPAADAVLLLRKSGNAVRSGSSATPASTDLLVVKHSQAAGLTIPLLSIPEYTLMASPEFAEEPSGHCHLPGTPARLD